MTASLKTLHTLLGTQQNANRHCCCCCSALPHCRSLNPPTPAGKCPSSLARPGKGSETHPDVLSLMLFSPKSDYGPFYSLSYHWGFMLSFKLSPTSIHRIIFASWLDGKFLLILKKSVKALCSSESHPRSHMRTIFSYSAGPDVSSELYRVWALVSLPFVMGLLTLSCNYLLEVSVFSVNCVLLGEGHLCILSAFQCLVHSYLSTQVCFCDVLYRSPSCTLDNQMVAMLLANGRDSTGDLDRFTELFSSEAENPKN